MTRRRYEYAEFLADIKALANALAADRFDAIVAVARGGLTIAHFLAIALNMRSVFSLRATSYDYDRKMSNLSINNMPNLEGFKRVLIADDIIDSGETMQAILRELKSRFAKTEFVVLSIFQKPSAPIEANYFAHKTDEWIDFFWEVDPIA